MSPPLPQPTRRARGGVTRVEVAVVVVLCIGVLLLVIPSVLQRRNNSRMMHGTDNLRHIWFGVMSSQDNEPQK